MADDLYSIPMVSEAIRRLRRAKGLSQRDLARLAHVTQSQVSAAEHGADLRVSTLIQLAGALDNEVALIPRRAAALVRQVIDSVPTS